MKVVYLILAWATAVSACSGKSGASQLRTTQNQSDDNYFACEGRLTQCALKKNLVYVGPEIEAYYTGHYSFSCTTGHESYPSNIILKVGDSKQVLHYGAQDAPLVSLIGYGDLILVDTDPAATRADFFDTKCSLSFDVHPVPSPNQAEKWSAAARSYGDRLRDQERNYQSRLDIETWSEIFLKSSDPSIKSVLEQHIVQLKASGKELDKLKAASLQGIIDGMPKDDLLKVFGESKAIILDILPKASSLLDTLNKWQQLSDSVLENAIQEAKISVAT